MKVLTKQGKYKEALDFMQQKAPYFEEGTIEREVKKANLHFRANNPIMTITIIFNILKANTVIENYEDQWPIYKFIIRVILNSYLPNNNFDFPMVENFASNETGGSSCYANPNANFDPVTVEDSLTKVMRVLYISLKNMRKVA